MSNPRYFHFSSPPLRSGCDVSHASLSLNSFGGSVAASASTQQHDLLGLPSAPASMHLDSSTPRTFQTTCQYPSHTPSSPYDDINFADTNSTLAFKSVENARHLWTDHYSLQAGDNRTAATTTTATSTTNAANTAAPAPAIQRFESESEPYRPWHPLRVTGAPNAAAEGPQAPNRQRQPAQVVAQCPPGPRSDLISRGAETDEGYFTTSQPDVQSVLSMNSWNFTPDPTNIHAFTAGAPTSHPRPAPATTVVQESPTRPLRLPNVSHQAVEPEDEAGRLICPVDDCDWTGKTQSEFKKHEARHECKFVCAVHGCPRKQGFATVNDLERHQKTVHKMQPAHGQSRDYRCFGTGCAKHDKIWPRLDNFKQHLKRMHKNEDKDLLLQKSEEWYERRSRSQAHHNPPGLSPATHQPSLSSAQLMPSQMTAPSPSHSNYTQWSQHRSGIGTAGEARHRPTLSSGSANLEQNLGPNRTSAGESLGPRTTNRTSNTGHALTPPSTYPCPFPQCTEGFSNVTLMKAHARKHDPRVLALAGYVPASEQASSMSWLANEPRMQEFPTQASSTWVPASMATVNGSQSGNVGMQSQPFPFNLHFSPRTASQPSVQTMDPSVEEMVDSIPQDFHCPPTGNDVDFAQIGHMSDDLPSNLPEPKNAVFATFSEQNSTPSGGEQTRLPSSSLTQVIKSFLQQHRSQTYDDARMNFTDSDVQRIIELIRSADEPPSVTDSGNMAGSSLTDEPTIRTATTSDGKTIYLCPDRQCKKSMDRLCDLKKHFQRHRRPYGCTFDKCGKFFGSSHDWKRHEYSQHVQQECWRCEEAHSNVSGRSIRGHGHEACRKVFETHDMYREHLTNEHQIVDPTTIDELSARQWIQRHSLGQYWCGFCNAIVKTSQKALEARAERFNHIDRHVRQGYRMKNWWPLVGEGTDSDQSGTAEHSPSSDQSSSDGANEEVTEDGVSPSPASAEAAPPTRRAEKRPASTGFQQVSDAAPKRNRVCNPRPARAIYCCNCREGPLNTTLMDSCPSLACSHKFCEHCPPQSWT